jgi:alpha-mannosidase
MFSPAEATRFATGLTQPLVVTRALDREHSLPLLTLSAKDVLVQALKPSEDGKAWIVSLFNCSSREAHVSLKWSMGVGAMHYSSTAELPLAAIRGDIDIAAWDLVTVRVER